MSDLAARAWMCGLLLAACCAVGAAQGRTRVTDVLTPLKPGAVKIGGLLGERIDLCIDRRILEQDTDALVKPFAENSDDRGTWRCEFWGKWASSVAAAHRYRQDDETKAKAMRAVTAILATQEPGGYIGTQAAEPFRARWDIWGRKYTLLGLIDIYRATGDDAALAAAGKLADHFIQQAVKTDTDVTRVGMWHGMASSSILEPLVQLYVLTGRQHYRKMAEHIVQRWEVDGGNHLLAKAVKGVAVAAMYEGPRPVKKGKRPRYGDMGQCKAYEMMSCFEGLLELYRVTGKDLLLTATRNVHDDIAAAEITAVGSGSDWERWNRTAAGQTGPLVMGMETCVSVYWMKLCADLLQLTGDMHYADEIELTMYNALLGAQGLDGRWWAHHIQTVGGKERAPEQCGMAQNCCVANGPRGMMLIPRLAVMKNRTGPVVNFYGRIDAEVEMTPRSRIKLEMRSDYPAGGAVKIRVTPSEPSTFILQLRVPAWSRRTLLWVNGKQEPVQPAGGFCRIRRRWQEGDEVELVLDMRTRAIPNDPDQPTHYCLQRGPVVFVRDKRLAGDQLHQPVSLITDDDGFVAASLLGDSLPENIAMGLSVPVHDGKGQKRALTLVDFASAGNTFDAQSHYRIWLPLAKPEP